MSIEVFANFSMLGDLEFLSPKSEFPKENPTKPTLIYIDGEGSVRSSLYLWTVVEGSWTWKPLTEDRKVKRFNFPTTLPTWTLPHGWNSDEVFAVLYRPDGTVILGSYQVDVTNLDKVVVDFTPGTANGYALLFGPGSVSTAGGAPAVDLTAEIQTALDEATSIGGIPLSKFITVDDQVDLGSVT